MSREATAASFVRQSKECDPSVAFLNAMRTKYGSGEGKSIDVQALDPLVIGGKKVDEVGFDIITQLQRAWSDLKIISLNSLGVSGVTSTPWLPESRQVALGQLAPLGLKCKELDLSRNLIENWYDIVDICSGLPELQTLKLK